MTTNLAAQRDALDELYLAYLSARDFTLPVLRIAFGNPPPPPDKCVWPAPGITQRELDSRLLGVQHWLQGAAHELPGVLREIHDGQKALVASRFDVPRSWIIPHPLEAFRGGMHGVCSVTEILESAPTEDAALEKVLGEISVDLVLVKGKIACLPTTAIVACSQPPCACADGELTNHTYDVFLAHNSKDKAAVVVIAEELKQHGIICWLDAEQIPPGRWFQNVIQAAIPKVKSAAIFIGPHGMGKWQAVELRSFISQCVERNIPVIPVLLPGVDATPDSLLILRELHWVKFKERLDEKEALDGLIYGG